MAVMAVLEAPDNAVRANRQILFSSAARPRPCRRTCSGFTRSFSELNDVFCAASANFQ